MLGSLASPEILATANLVGGKLNRRIRLSFGVGSESSVAPRGIPNRITQPLSQAICVTGLVIAMDSARAVFAMPSSANIYQLGIKELWNLARDPVMLLLIVHAFTLAIYVSATAIPETLNKAPIAIVDEDDSPLSKRIATAFFLPHFKPPVMISLADIDRGMDAGEYTFVLDIPPDFQRDVLDGKSPAIQLNVDATQMGQAFSGSSYVQQMVLSEVQEFVLRYRTTQIEPVELAMRARFNPNLDQIWFGGLMEIINNVTMLSIILTGAALIREREHGTIEHLLVMPVTPTEIMLAKVWSMSFVVLISSAFSLVFIVQGILKVPIEGSIGLFLVGTTLHLFAATSMGIWMATLARSMPQFGLLAVLILLPLQMLSGNSSPRESMPQLVQNAMLLAPTTHYVMLAQAILFRGAGLAAVWPQLLALAMIGAAFFGFAAAQFRRSVAQSSYS